MPSRPVEPGAERIAKRFGAIAGVAEAPSRFGDRGRMAWRAGTREIAHLHAADLIDIRIPAALQRRWQNDGRLIPRRRRSDWIECRCRSPQDLEFAAMLVTIAAQNAAK